MLCAVLPFLWKKVSSASLSALSAPVRSPFWICWLVWTAILPVPSFWTGSKCPKLTEYLRHDELIRWWRQCISIARTLAKKTKLLLCDGPTGTLDYVTGKNILKLLQDTCRSTGKMIIVITHNTAITTMADRFI